jgi:pyruvate formate lyase activating enzyme
MVFAGMQKLSLLDYPGVVACTLFTLGCNFRCPWCHNAGLVLPDQFPEGTLDADEVLSFLKKRQGILDGVAVTGGEPLLHEELPDFLAEVRALGYRVKLDTNGSFPDRLIKVVESGLADMVAMDIKNGPSHYGRTIGLKGAVPAAVEKSKDYLLSGPVEYEFRTTVVRGFHTEESLLEAADWIQGARVWYLQQFQDSGALIQGEGLSAFSNEEMQHLLTILQKKLPAVKLRGI